MGSLSQVNFKLLVTCSRQSLAELPPRPALGQYPWTITATLVIVPIRVINRDMDLLETSMPHQAESSTPRCRHCRVVNDAEVAPEHLSALSKSKIAASPSQERPFDIGQPPIAKGRAIELRIVLPDVICNASSWRT